jgi:hypothetical protein
MIRYETKDYSLVRDYQSDPLVPSLISLRESQRVVTEISRMPLTTNIVECYNSHQARLFPERL